MPIRRIVRASCAALMLGSLVFGIPGQGVVWAINHVLGVCIALFLVWASMRAGYRKPGFVLLGGAVPAWALLIVEGTSMSALIFGAAMLVGMGSCVVHYQSDPLVLGQGGD
jgi:hypothetical protein